MKINKLERDGIVRFENIDVGEVFVSDKIVYLKTQFFSDRRDTPYNCVNLVNGSIYFFNDKVRVQQCEEAELTIKV